MKRIIFIGLIALGGIAMLAGIGLTIMELGDLSNTNEVISLMEESKLTTIEGSANFVNETEKFKSVDLEGRDISRYKASYKKDDIYFLSTVNEWDENMLRKLADELYANKHGEEIEYVYSVILYPSDGEPYIGTYESLKENFDIPVSFYNFLPDDILFDYASNLSEISLYDAENKVTVEEMAITLSHEYGHHFSEYHFGLKYDKTDRLTEYFDIRSQGTTKIVLERKSTEEYLRNHMWYLAEIAAEDFVYIMGSENAHQTAEFYDDYGMYKYYVDNGVEAADKINYYYKDCRNGIPHENMSLPLPDDVDGLYEFFYSFIEEDAPQIDSNESIGTLNLKTDRTSNAYNGITVTWDQPYEDEDVIYTLIVYDDEDNLFLIEKTTHGGDATGTSVFGATKIRYYKGRFVYYYEQNWDFIKGHTIRFRVSVTFPDGRVELSEPIDVVY